MLVKLFLETFHSRVHNSTKAALKVTDPDRLISVFLTNVVSTIQANEIDFSFIIECVGNNVRTVVTQKSMSNFDKSIIFIHSQEID